MIRRLVARDAWLRIRRRRWKTLIVELGRRAGGERESGAFLLARRNDPLRAVIDVAYYDDLDPDSLTGGVSFGFSGFGPLWDLCEQHGLTVVGDVHTHGGTMVTQSKTDRENPMVARVGHIAVIVPHLAARPVPTNRAGVHRYLGDAGWDSRTERAAARALYVGWWA